MGTLIYQKTLVIASLTFCILITVLAINEMREGKRDFLNIVFLIVSIFMAIGLLGVSMQYFGGL